MLRTNSQFMVRSRPCSRDAFHPPGGATILPAGGAMSVTAKVLLVGTYYLHNKCPIAVVFHCIGMFNSRRHRGDCHPRVIFSRCTPYLGILFVAV